MEETPLDPFTFGRTVHKQVQSGLTRTLAQMALLAQFRGMLIALSAAMHARPSGEAAQLQRYAEIWWLGWVTRGFFYEACNTQASPLIPALRDEQEVFALFRRLLPSAFVTMPAAEKRGLPKIEDGEAQVPIGDLVTIFQGFIDSTH